ncbi:MAG: CHASE3 domain-containing protein [Chitinophagaceae bacterium]
MKNLRLTSVSFAISLAIMVVLSLLFYDRLKQYTSYADAVNHTYQLIATLNKLENYIKDAETSQRGYFLLHDTTMLEPYKNFSKNIQPAVDSLRGLVRDDDTLQKERLLQLRYAVIIRMAYMERMRQMADAHENESRLMALLKESDNAMDSVRFRIRSMEEAEQRALQQKTALKNIYELSLPAYLGVIFVFAIIIFIVSFVFIVLEYRRRLLYQRELEMKNIELSAYNQELQQITYVASHDLQEPLRKIRTFTSRLEGRHTTELGEEGTHIVKRLAQSAVNMQELIEDIMNYTSLASSNELQKKADLNTILEDVLTDIEPVILERKAKVKLENQLPVIPGYRTQLYLLLRSLLDNSLKFARENVPLVITISYEQARETEATDISEPMNDRTFYKITISDNGIGFSQEFADKIFNLFQRLHQPQSEYKGKGIGLAIVKRIMLNHNGFVKATATENGGASFHLYFPVK